MNPPTTPSALQVSGLGKRFDIYPNDRSRFFEFLGDRTHHAEHWALRGVSFEVPAGRSFGVIGANGAGKSTLLRLVSGITEPTEGEVAVAGRMATLLDLGIGFMDHFTGRENVRLNCALLGMSAAQIEARFPEIIRFAELGDFIDHPVRTYSTGMNLRLGFAVAVHSDADVLVVDEVLAVGDQYFQRKCIRKIEEILGEGRTLLLVSHDLHAVRSLCDEAMWLDQGRARAVGPPREVIEQYLELDRLRIAPARPGTPIRPVETFDPEGLQTRAPAVDLHRPGRVFTLPNMRFLEDDPQVRTAIASATSLPVAPEVLFEEPGGEAPRKLDGDTLVVSGTGEARILRVQILDALGQERERFRTGESLVIASTFRTVEPIFRPIFGVALFRSDGTYVFGPNTRFDNVLDGSFHGVYTWYVHYPKLPLLAGTYRVSVAIFDKNHLKPHVWHNQLYQFDVSQDVEDHGLVQLPHRWGMVTHLDAGAPPDPDRRQ